MSGRMKLFSGFNQRITDQVNRAVPEGVAKELNLYLCVCVYIYTINWNLLESKLIQVNS